jgi:hypothetical protein
MRLDPNPLFRRVITPWYDSNMVCGILLLAMAVIIIFSSVGIAAAREYAAYHAYVWVPSTLLALSVTATRPVRMSADPAAIVLLNS